MGLSVRVAPRPAHLREVAVAAVVGIVRGKKGPGCHLIEQVAEKIRQARQLEPGEDVPLVLPPPRGEMILTGDDLTTQQPLGGFGVDAVLEPPAAVENVSQNGRPTASACRNCAANIAVTA